MKIQILIITFLFSQIFLSQNKNICITFDDLPFVNYGMNDTTFQCGVVDNLIKKLKKFNVPAIGFVNERKLYKDDGLSSFQVSLLENWVMNNLELGNHTFSHPDYNKVDFKTFADDLLKGEFISKKILAKENKTLKYFRHPFLHVGNTKEKADSLKNFLHRNNYIAAPVTIDNEDYWFAVAYKRAKVSNDSALAKRIGEDFINYIERKLHYFEEQSNKLFGENINQILLLHASWLNSDYIDSIIKMLDKNGYSFVNMDEALEDELYLTPINVYGDWGISWLDRWAFSQGKKGDFFNDDPATPGYIKQMAR